MKNTTAKIAMFSLVAALLVPTLCQAQGTGTNTVAGSMTNAIHVPNPPHRLPPIHGSIVAVNTADLTFAVGKSVFTVTPKTRIFKANKAAALADLKVGDTVIVSYLKTEDGTLNAIGIRVVIRPPVPPRQPVNGTAALPTPPNRSATNN